MAHLIADQQQQLYSLIAIDLGPSAVREGESTLFTDNVRKSLVEVRNNQSLMFPLFSTIGVTILYVPPKTGKVIDADNLNVTSDSHRARGTETAEHSDSRRQHVRGRPQKRMGRPNTAKNSSL